jgi:hypothetical protein
LFRWSLTIQLPGALEPSASANIRALKLSVPVGSVKHWLQDIAKKWIFQLEVGEEGRPHYQGSVQLKKKQRKSGLLNGWKRVMGEAKGNFLTLRPTSTSGSTAAFQYCLKEDTRKEGPWADQPIYLGQDLTMITASPHPWQAELMAWIKEKPDDRSVVWIYNQAGNVGKSKLCKYLAWKGLAKLITGGSAQQLKSAIFTAGAKRCYTVDIPRTRGKEERMEDILSVLEALKNGFVQDHMYGKDNELFMEPPHVMCFSNAPPPYQKLSVDRWKMFTITEEMELEPWTPTPTAAAQPGFLPPN